MRPNTIKITWHRINCAIQELADHLSSEFGPDIDSSEVLIVAITRGGGIPGIMLSNKLKLPITFFEVTSYKEQERGSLRVINSPNLVAIADPKLKHVVIIDDVVDSGATLAFVRNFVFGVRLDLCPETTIHPVALYDIGPPDEGPIKFRTFGVYDSGEDAEIAVSDKGFWLVFPWEV